MDWYYWKKFLSVEVIVLLGLLIACIWVYCKSVKRVKLFEPPKRATEDVVDFSLALPVVAAKPKKKKYWKNQEICRKIFEDIFQQKFPSIRPDFLKNPVTGYNLELDGYCEKLKLAFEYDGGQHSKYTPVFHKSVKDFSYQVVKDDFKTKKCKEQGITLIRIPHHIHRTKLRDYILRVLRESGLV